MGTAFVTATAVTLSVTAVPVIIAMAVVVGGYILAATIVDYVDNEWKIKETVAKVAR